MNHNKRVTRRRVGFVLLAAMLLLVGFLIFGAVAEREAHRPESAAGYFTACALVILGGILLAGLAPNDKLF